MGSPKDQDETSSARQPAYCNFANQTKGSRRKNPTPWEEGGGRREAGKALDQKDNAQAEDGTGFRTQVAGLRTQLG